MPRKFSHGEFVRFWMKRDTARRIHDRHFNGSSLQLACKFFLYHDVYELFDYVHHNDDLTRRIINWLKIDGEGTYSFEIPHNDHIGWAGTEDRNKFSDEDLEMFQINVRATALRVKLDRKRLRAPLTKILTVICEVTRNEDEVSVEIKSAYPGPDVGALKGNITKKCGVVFFDFSHPGVLLP